MRTSGKLHLNMPSVRGVVRIVRSPDFEFRIRDSGAFRLAGRMARSGVGPVVSATRLLVTKSSYFAWGSILIRGRPGNCALVFRVF